MFVITGVRQIRHPEFDSATRSLLAAVRFPAYYAFGMSCLVIAANCALFCLLKDRGNRGLKTAAFLLFGAIGLMVVDWIWIYLPLSEMNLMDPRPAEFHSYHKASMYINFGGLACTLASAMLLCRPQLTTGDDDQRK